MDDYFFEDSCSTSLEAFHKLESNSYQNTNEQKFIKYGAGSITGSISIDTVNIAGLNAFEFEFIAAPPFQYKT